jgi:hypothetical protein
MRPTSGGVSRVSTLMQGKSGKLHPQITRRRRYRTSVSNTSHKTLPMLEHSAASTHPPQTTTLAQRLSGQTTRPVTLQVSWATTRSMSPLRTLLPTASSSSVHHIPLPVKQLSRHRRLGTKTTTRHVHHRALRQDRHTRRLTAQSCHQRHPSPVSTPLGCIDNTPSLQTAQAQSTDYHRPANYLPSRLYGQGLPLESSRSQLHLWRAHCRSNPPFRLNF